MKGHAGHCEGIDFHEWENLGIRSLVSFSGHPIDISDVACPVLHFNHFAPLNIFSSFSSLIFFISK